MYLISLLILAIAVSFDSFLYGMVYEICNIRVKVLSLLLFCLSGWVILIFFGVTGRVLVILLPVILAKLIGIIALLICSIIILKDIITYKKGRLRVGLGTVKSFYISEDKNKYDNFSKLIYYPVVSEESREMKILEGLLLGVIINLDGGVVMFTLGIIEGRIIHSSVIFIMICLIFYKLGNILVEKDFINKSK